MKGGARKRKRISRKGSLVRATVTIMMTRVIRKMLLNI